MTLQLWFEWRGLLTFTVLPRWWRPEMRTSRHALAPHVPPTFKGNLRVLPDLIEQHGEGGQKKIQRLRDTVSGKVIRRERKDGKQKDKVKARAWENTTEEDKAIEKFDSEGMMVNLLH